MENSTEESVDYGSLASGEIRLLRLDLDARKHQECDDEHTLISDSSNADSSFVPGASLETVTLDAKLEYHAISYMWGDAQDRKPVMIDGRRVMVTANLRNALEDVLRNILCNPADDFVLEALPIWADAICINQLDIYEKSAQVQRMGEIFASAQRVLVFADQSSSETEVGTAFEIIQQLARLSRDHHWSVLMNNAAKNVAEYPQVTKEKYYAMIRPIVGRSRDQMNSLYAFTQRKKGWWERAWVVQEIALAKTDRVLLVRGAMLMEWNALIAAHKWNTLEAGAFGYKGRSILIKDLPPEQKDNWMTVNKAIGNFTPFLTSLRVLGPGKALCDHLFWTRVMSESPTKATIPHDLIYSLLPMASDRQACGIVSDYNKAFQELCRDIAVYLLDAWQGVALQCFRYREGDTDVPYSWIPNWTRMTGLKPFSFHNGGSLYNASASRRAWRYRVDGFKLCLFVRYVGEITHAGNMGSEFTEWSVNNPLDIEAARDWVVAFKTFLDATPHIPEKRRMSAWRVPIADRDITTDQMQIRAGQELQRGFDRLVASALEQNESGSKVENYSWNLNVTITYSRGPPAIGREVFVTDNGFIGLGPPSLQSKDLVYIIAGHDMPLVLRRTGCGAYIIIGEAFVDGIMDGELASSIRNMEEITIA